MTVQLVVHTTPVVATARELREQRQAWDARRQARTRGPIARQHRSALPATRPVQPAVPAVNVLPGQLIAGPSTRVIGGRGWRLTDRGLTVVLIAFLLAVVLGGVVVGTQVAQFLAETSAAEVSMSASAGIGSLG